LELVQLGVRGLDDYSQVLPIPRKARIMLVYGWRITSTKYDRKTLEGFGTFVLHPIFWYILER
jgi:hypothetical protein